MQNNMQKSALRTQSTRGELFSPFVLKRKQQCLEPLPNVRKIVSLRPQAETTASMKKSRLGNFITLKLHPSKSVPVGHKSTAREGLITIDD